MAADARIIFPERDHPLAEGAGLSVKSQSLANKRGSLPLDAFLEMIDRINVTHGGERGTLVLSAKGGAAR
jgi:hypothetical protein